MKFLLTTIFAVLVSFQAFANFGAYQNTTNLGLYQNIKCASGLSCTKVGSQLQMVAQPTIAGGITGVNGFTNFGEYDISVLTSGSTSAMIINGNSGTIYLSQVYVPFNATLTGIQIANGPTVGTNKYILALYNALGVLVANTNLSGTLTASAATYQPIPFTTSASVVGPGVYWIGANINGSTDNFLTAPSGAIARGLGGTVSGAAFGVLSGTISLPTTFNSRTSPVTFTY